LVQSSSRDDIDCSTHARLLELRYKASQASCGKSYLITRFRYITMSVQLRFRTVQIDLLRETEDGKLWYGGAARSEKERRSA